VEIEEESKMDPRTSFQVIERDEGQMEVLPETFYSE